jgi:trehalose 2-sulfotransferase
MQSLEEYAQWVLQPPLPEQSAKPRSSYFVCGTPRSGSWFLCGLLASTGVAGRPHEWFWSDTEHANRRAWGVSSFAEYLDHVRDAATTPNGVLGAKLMWGYLPDLLARLRQLGDASPELALIERHFPRPRFVWIRREDLIAQAVSWSKAIQTGRWHHWDRGDPAAVPAYDRKQIDALAREAAAHDAGWRAWFEANGIEPLIVRFEALVGDSLATTRAVLQFLDIDADGVAITPLTVPTSDLQ